MKKSYFKRKWKEFLNSFKLSTSFIYVLLFDVLYVSLAILALVVFGKLAQNLIMKLNALNLQEITNTTLMENQVKTLTSVMNSLLIYTILLLLVLFILCIITRALIWNIVLNKKLTLKYLGKFSVLNLIWLLWIIPFILILSTKNPYSILISSIILAILFIYFTFVLYTIFTKEVKIGKSLKLCFKLGAGKINLFLLPMLFAIVVFVLVNIIVVAANLIVQSSLIALILLLLYTAWLRFYCSSVTLRIAKTIKKS